jgi:serine/threonine-protein kinase
MTDDKKIPEISNIEPIQEGSPDADGPVHTGTPLQSAKPPPVKEKPEDPNLGKILKQTYTLVKKVGEGGMGDVYKAIQSPLNREVAVKLLKPNDNNPEGEHYFMREVQAINMLRHPNIIQIVDFGKEPDGTLYLVMEYLPGKTLKRVIRKEYPLDPRRIAHICIQTLSALEQAHKSGIVHCDLKPANLMLEEVAGQADFIKVLDFGIAKVKGPAMEAGPYTQAGNIVGTFDYMSPEQIMRKDLDGRADIWSMGVIMYEMLTKKRVFHDKDAVSIIGRVMQMPITPPIDVLKGTIPPELDDIVMKAMERNVEKRFQSAADMREALQRFLSGLDAGAFRAGVRSNTGVIDDSGVHSGSGVHSSSLGSGNLQSGPSSLIGNTGVSSVVSRSGGFGGTGRIGGTGRVGTGRIGESQRMATGIASGTSVLDQTFSIDALQDSLLGERRKVAVLAIQQRARRRGGIDPEELARRSRQEALIIKELVQHYEGEVDSFMGGTYTILFGATRARVGDNMRALECAKAIQERFRLLEQGFQHLGVGLCYGEVFISSRKGGNAYGEAIDRCVEIARGATDAKILVDDSLVQLTKGQVQYDAPIPITGEPVCEVLGIKAGAAAEQAEQEEAALNDVDVYVPRPRFYDELVRRAASVKDGQGGGVAMLGEAGLGKTTLLDRFTEEQEKKGWQVFKVKARELGTGQQLPALRAWIRQIANTYKDPRVLVRKACESIGLKQRVEAVVKLFVDEDGDKLSPAQLPFQDQNALAYFTAALFHRMLRFALKKGPLILYFDDLDPTDHVTQNFFDTFLTQIGKFQVLLLTSVRMDATVVDHGLSANFEILRLEGFEMPESRQFISQLLGFTPPPNVLAQLHDRASGNPMFLREIIRALVKIGGTQALADETSVLESGIPLNLQELLAQRIDELPDHLRDLMAVASVLGESFREDFFYQVTPAHLGPQVGLQEMVALGVFEARQDAFGRIVVGFNPRSMRSVVYERIPKATRRQIHASVIEFLEQAPQAAAVDDIDVPLMLAFHYRSVEGFEGASHYLSEVGDILLDMYDYDGANSYFRDAIELVVDRVPANHDLLVNARLKLITGLREAGHVEEAQSIISSMPKLEEMPQQYHIDFLLEQGQVGMESGSIGTSTEALFKVVELARQAQDVKLEIKGLLSLSQVFEKENQLQRAANILIEVSQKVAALGDLDMNDPDDRRLFWTAYNQLGTLCIRQNQIQQALQYLQEAMNRAQGIQDHRGLVRIVSNMGALFFAVRDMPNAIKYFENALELARATGDLLNQSRILINMGRAAMEGNDLEKAKQSFRESRSIAEEIGWYEGLADLSLYIKQLRKMLGR